MSLSIAAHGDPAQTSLGLLYPEQCSDCRAPIHDWRPRQRVCTACRREHRRALERRRYRERADVRDRRLAAANQRYRLRKHGKAA
jgi:hypothetical protein